MCRRNAALVSVLAASFVLAAQASHANPAPPAPPLPPPLPNAPILNIPGSITVKLPTGLVQTYSGVGNTFSLPPGSIITAGNISGISIGRVFSSGAIINISNIAILPTLPSNVGNIAIPATSTNITVTTPSINTSIPTTQTLNAINNINLPLIPNLGVPTDRIRWGIHFDRKLQGLTANNKQKAKILKTMSGSVPFRPVASTTPAAMLPILNLTAIEKSGFSVRHNGGAQLNAVSDNELHASRGAFLIVAHKPSSIKLGDCTVLQKAGTITQITVNDDLIQVHSLVDNRADSVRVISAGKHFSLQAGTEFCLSKNKESVHSAFNDGLGRRETISHKMSNGNLAVSSYISVPSILAQNEILRSMYKKNESERALVQKVMKMAVCLEFTLGKHGPYKVNEGYQPGKTN